MLFDYISLPVFLISFAIGLFFVYIIGPEVKTVFIYPSPSNTDTMQYQDNTDQCFKFSPSEIDCPINPLSIKTVPLQT